MNASLPRSDIIPSDHVFFQGYRDNSLERELASEDCTVGAGMASQEKRKMAKEEKERQREADRQADMKQQMLDAAQASQEKRKKNKQ